MHNQNLIRIISSMYEALSWRIPRTKVGTYTVKLMSKKAVFGQAYVVIRGSAYAESYESFVAGR